MVKMSAALRLLIAGFLSLSLSSTPALASSSGNSTYCGGQVEVAVVERYFSDLKRALEQPGPKARFNLFVDTQFGVRSKAGRTLYFNLKDIGSVKPGRISVQEWQEISRRGAQSLNDAGWRGCFMDHGKVWFVGSKEGGFRLVLISRDMPWAKPEEGTVMKMAHPAD
jgi:hypothetical protein